MDNGTPIQRDFQAHLRKQLKDAGKRRGKELQDLQHRQELEAQEEKRKHRASRQFHREHPVAPGHPDEGKEFTPDQTFEVTSGGFCFGLRSDAQEAAKEPLMSFDDVTTRTSVRSHGPVTCNTVAQNGTWNGYKLVSRTDYDGESLSGWLICREGLDPVFEVRQLLYHTVDRYSCDGGGGFIESPGGTSEHHRELGFAVYPRYIFGTVYEFSEEEGQKLLNEGLYLVDYDQAQATGTSAKKWKNAIRGMHTCGDFDVAGLSYTKEGQCKSFLLYGNNCNDFRRVYFPNGTAPLGQEEWQHDCYCPEHGCSDRTISVDDYLKRSKTKLCLNTKPYQEMMMEMKKEIAATKKRKKKTNPEARKRGQTNNTHVAQKKITQFFKPRN